MMVSVIIPVYNVSKTLQKCVSSVLSQTYKNIEVILVNDASTDDSLHICRKLALGDKRVKVIDKQCNEGVEKARISGLKMLSEDSTYVMFVDSDDWLKQGIISKCVSLAEETKADCVQFGMVRVLDRFGIIKLDRSRKLVPEDKNHILVTSKDDEFEDYLLSFYGVSFLPVCLWGKLYRSDLIRKSFLSATGLRWGEDLIWNMWIFSHVKRLVVIDNIGYYYRYGGMSTRMLPDLLPMMMKIYKLKMASIKSKNFYRAVLPVKVELKNVLYVAIAQRIEYKYGVEKDNIQWLAKMLDNPIWDSVEELKNESQYVDDLFLQNIAKKDAEGLWRMVSSNTKPHGIKWRVRNGILRLFSK